MDIFNFSLAKNKVTFILIVVLTLSAKDMLAQLEVNIAGIEPSCYSYSNGSLLAEASGGEEPYAYEWSTGDDSAYISADPGDYFLTVTDNTGQTVVLEYTLEQPAPLGGNIDLIGELCNSTTGSLSAQPVGGTTPYSYEWSTGATTQDISNLEDEHYFVTIQDANGCLEVLNRNVSAPLEVEVEGLDVACFGYCDGSAHANVTGGYAPISVIWDNGNTGTVNFPLAVGTYCVTVTDGAGCQAMACGEVGQPDLLEVSISLDGDCDDNTILSATAEVDGGTEPYDLSWSTGESSMTISNLEIGDTYSVSVEDANGCDQSESFTVGEFSQIDLTITSTDESCSGEHDGVATVTPEGGTEPYTILWSNGQNENTIFNLEPGFYEVSVSDATGCMSVQSVEVDNGTILYIDVDTEMASCNGEPDGSFVIEPGGGMFPYSFEYPDGIDGQANSGVVSNVAAGTYTVIVRDAEGCEQQVEVIILEENAFDIELSSIDATCPDALDGSALLFNITGEAVEPLSYSWSNGAVTPEISDLLPGNYTLVVTDANNCSTSETVTVGTTSELDLPFTVEVMDCQGEQVLVSVVGDFGNDISSFSYTVNGTMSFDTESFEVLVPAGTDMTIEVEGSNAQNCYGSETQVINIPASVIADINPLLQSCVGDELIANVASEQELTSQWSPEDLFIGATDIANPMVNTDSVGEFSANVTLINEYGCQITEVVMIEIMNPIPAPNVMMVSSLQNCEDFAVNFVNNNDGADAYQWSFDYPNNTDIGTGTMVDYTFPGEGTYQVALIPTVECAEILVFDIDVLPTEEVSINFDLDCDEDFQFDFTPNVSNIDSVASFVWIIDGTEYDELDPSVIFEEDGNVDVSLVVTYNNGCEVEAMLNDIEVDLFEPELPMAQAINCNNNGTTLNPSYNENYEYEWSPAIDFDPNDPNPMVNLEDEIEFSVTIVDLGSGCNVVSTVTYIVPDAIVNPNLQDVIVCDEIDVELNAETENGEDYAWYENPDLEGNVLSNNATYSPEASLESQTYYVEITDEFGCTNVFEASVVATPVEFDFTAEQSNICADELLELNLPDGYLYDFDGVDPTQSEISESGVFPITITGDNGCELELDLELNLIDLTDEVSVSAEPDTIIKGEESQLIVTLVDGYDYEWNEGSTLDFDDVFNPVATPGETILYTATVTGMGCTSEVTQQVVVLNTCKEFIYFPNAFTPNDDGLNDELELKGFALEEIYYVIYNRWGEKVFETNNFDTFWDGTHKGEKVCPDVYGYYLEVKCVNGEEYFEKGNVSVLK